jgi:hypothetical protein
MAANKKSVIEEGVTNSAVKVGSGDQETSLSWRHTKQVFLIILACIAVVVIVVLVIGYLVKPGQKVYAEAAGHKIYKKDIDNLIGGTKGVTYHQAATVLANKYLYDAMTQKAGIKVTSQQIKAQYADIDSQRTHNSYVYQDNVNNVYYDQLMAYNQGLYKGKVLATNFSRYIAFQSPYIDIQKITNPLLGNQAAVNKDKQYAHDLITNLYNQVKSKKITFDQAIQIEHKDPQVGENAYPTEPHSGSFDTSNRFLSGTNLLLPPSIQPKLARMKAGQLSTPFAVRVQNAWKNPKITTETYYLVVRMDSTKGSHSGLTWDKYLSQQKRQYDYRVNV